MKQILLNWDDQLRQSLWWPCHLVFLCNWGCTVHGSCIQNKHAPNVAIANVLGYGMVWSWVAVRDVAIPVIAHLICCTWHSDVMTRVRPTCTPSHSFHPRSPSVGLVFACFPVAKICLAIWRILLPESVLHYSVPCSNIHLSPPDQVGLSLSLSLNLRYPCSLTFQASWMWFMWLSSAGRFWSSDSSVPIESSLTHIGQVGIPNSWEIWVTLEPAGYLGYTGGRQAMF